MIDASSWRDSTMASSWIHWMLRQVVAFVVAACAMVLLGSAALVFRATGLVWCRGPPLEPRRPPFHSPNRVTWAAHGDLVGMFVPYSAVTSIALPFLIAGVLALHRFRVIVFGVGGALALFVFTIMRSNRDSGHFRRARAVRPCGANGDRRRCGRAFRQDDRASQRFRIHPPSTIGSRD